MDKLKYIKIENEDGSLSDNIPLGVDAENVDTNDGSTVEIELNNLKNKDSSQDNSINNLNDKINIQDNSINNLKNQINSLASGSPLVASSVSEMTDTSKVYVNTTDGHWYYYNGTNWIAGGVYQAESNYEVEQNIKLDRKKLKNIKAFFNKFLYSSWFQKCEFEKGAFDYAQGTGVNLDSNKRIRSTVLLKLLGGTTIKIKEGFKVAYTCYFRDDNIRGESSMRGYPFAKQNNQTTFTQDNIYVKNDCFVKIILAYVDDREIDNINEFENSLMFDYDDNKWTYGYYTVENNDTIITEVNTSISNKSLLYIEGETTISIENGYQYEYKFMNQLLGSPLGIQRWTSDTIKINGRGYLCISIKKEVTSEILDIENVVNKISITSCDGIINDIPNINLIDMGQENNLLASDGNNGFIWKNIINGNEVEY